jgi:FKBP-type peptidyl-prolyl cis-trans isomerase
MIGLVYVRENAVNKFATFLFAALLLTACNFGASPTNSPQTAGPQASKVSATSIPPTNVPPTNVPPTATPKPTVAPTSAPAPTTDSAAQNLGTGKCTQGTGQMVTMASELKYEDLLICDGTAARSGMAITIQYTGTLKDGGAKFDSSYDRGQPYTFTLGSGPIRGWDEGIVGMKVGGKRRLIIPPSLGYGNQSHAGSPANVPANSTLVYDIELVSAK